MFFTEDELSDGRDSIEFLLMRLDEKQPELRSMALCCLWASIGVIPNEILKNIEDKKYPALEPDFYDKDGRPRLLLSTIASTLGIEQHLIDERPAYGLENDKFRCAIDFIRLTGEKYVDATGKMRKLYLKSWHDFHEGAPAELKKEMDNKFQEILGKQFAAMKPIGVDEKGNKVFTAAEIAKALGITEEEAIRHAQEMQEIGATGFFSMPVSDDDDKTH